MKISIVTPSFNQGHYIEETIQSILSQKGDFEVEYFIMDGGSTDNTVDILRKYGDKIHWVSESDRGHSDAINKGMRMATGDIVAYLNSDDIYCPGAFQKVADFFGKHPGKKWVYGKCRIVNEEGKEIRKWITAYKNFLLKKYSYFKLLTENFISQPATFWRRELLDEFGYFDENQHLIMDYDYWLRIGKKYDAGVIQECLADYRWYPDTKSGSRFKEQFRDELEAAKKYADGRKLPLFIHAFNVWKIVTVYRILQYKNRRFST